VKGWVIGSAIVMAPAISAAQQPSRAAVDELIRNRQNISMIEGMFERAVQNGVDNFSRRLQEISPNADGMAMLMGAPQVRGFRLGEGIGVFFDVQMPSLQLSMVWPLRYAQGADAAAAQSLAELRNTLQQVSDPQMRAELSQKLRDIEQQMAESSAVRRRTGGVTPVAAVQSAAPAPPASPADMAILDDPADAWRSEVRSTLIDAMIQNTGGVSIGPDEFIIIAARGVLSPDRLIADPGASRTIELRLKGSDLAAFRSGTITLEDARKRVVVREY